MIFSEAASCWHCVLTPIIDITLTPKYGAPHGAPHTQERVRHPEQMPRPLAVIDLDGVVADVRHRLHHVTGRRRDWDAFFDGIADDPVLPEGRAVAEQLAADHDLVYLTGRPERTRPQTDEWLARHQLPHGKVIMRPEGDRRPARLLKPRLLRSLAADRRVAVVVDDDVEVCDALERSGWQVLRADWMGDAPPLRRAQESEGAT